MTLTGLTNLQPLHIKTVGIGTFDNAVSIGGTLTYEDVTNVDAIGIITARSGINVSGGQLDVGSNIKLGNAGVITATSFVGNITGTASQVTIANGADNRVLTAASANTLNGEANLTYNGTHLTTKGADSTTSANAGGSGLLIQNTNNTNNNQNFLGFYDSTGTSSAAIIAQHENHSSTTGNLQFGTRNAGTYAERLSIDSAGRIGIGENNPTRDIVIKRSGSVQFSMVGATNQSVYLNFGDTDDDNIGAVYYDNPNDRMIIRANTNNAVQVKSNGNMAINDGDLEIGTSGHGIDFSAQTPTSATGASTTAELLDHYEEGSWTPVFLNVNTPSYTTQYGIYTRVGRMVLLHGQLSVSSIDNSDGSTVNIGGFPFVGNSTAETCLFTFGRYTNLIPESKLDQFTNARFGGNYVMLHEGNNADISYAELNSSGTIQFSVSYMMS